MVIFCCVFFLKAFVSHPDLHTSKKNRDFMLEQISKAVNTIAGVAQAVGESKPHPYQEIGYLAKAIHELEVN